MLIKTPDPSFPIVQLDSTDVLFMKMLLFQPRVPAVKMSGLTSSAGRRLSRRRLLIGPDRRQGDGGHEGDG